MGGWLEFAVELARGHISRKGEKVWMSASLRGGGLALAEMRESAVVEERRERYDKRRMRRGGIVEVIPEHLHLILFDTRWYVQTIYSTTFPSPMTYWKTQSFLSHHSNSLLSH